MQDSQDKETSTNDVQENTKRNPGGGDIFRTRPNQYTHTMDTGSILGVKRPTCNVNHPLPSTVKVKERVEPYLYSPSGPLLPVQG